MDTKLFWMRATFIFDNPKQSISMSSAEVESHSLLQSTRPENGSKDSEDDEYVHFFLSEAAADRLPHFQYKGQDRSLTYKYILSPLAEKCVHSLTPRSIAPNTITLVGLTFMFCSYLATWVYVPMILLQVDQRVEQLDAVPRWIFLLNAIATLVYQTLDNMDGKQARRVGASSPLGLLFDHGCDAVNSCWMVCLALGRNDAFWVYIMLMGPYAMFFISTWEEYFTGELIMPIINGPNEGLLGSVVVSLISCIYGPSFWQTESLWNNVWLRGLLGSIASTAYIELLPPLRNGDVLILISSIGFVQEVLSKSVLVSQSHGLISLLHQLPFATLCLCYLAIGWYDSTIWFDLPRTSIHLCSFLFVEMTTELMLKHVTHQRYQPCRLILLPLVLFTLIVCSGNQHLIHTGDYLLIYASVAGVYVAMKCVLIIHEMCSILGIWCFDITTPRRKRRFRQQ
jgi:ethanolaminephosphotransferase